MKRPRRKTKLQGRRFTVQKAGGLKDLHGEHNPRSTEETTIEAIRDGKGHLVALEINGTLHPTDRKIIVDMQILEHVSPSALPKEACVDFPEDYRPGFRIHAVQHSTGNEAEVVCLYRVSEAQFRNVTYYRNFTTSVTEALRIQERSANDVSILLEVHNEAGYLIAFVLTIPGSTFADLFQKARARWNKVYQPIVSSPSEHER